MKKSKKKYSILFLFVALAVILIVFLGSGPVASQESIAQKIIRFHVLANSDSEKDQSLKLKVKDNVLSYTTNILGNSKSIDESRKLLQENDSKIKKIAESTIKNLGYSYAVKTELSEENFPVKSYGNITLPQGEYEAYRIIIGDGSGKNWWCVMFPPLCFVDATKGEVEKKKTSDEMKEVLNQDEYKLVDNEPKSSVNTSENGDDFDRSKIVFRSKVFDFFQSIFKW